MRKGKQLDLCQSRKDINESFIRTPQGLVDMKAEPINYANEERAGFGEIVAIPQIYVWRVSFHFRQKPFPFGMEGEEEEKPLNAMLMYSERGKNEST